MSYTTVAKNIRDKASKLNEVISNIERINFGSAWGGSAYTTQMNDLKSCLTALKTQRDNANKLADSLDNLQTYKDNDEKISSLNSSLRRLSDTPENQAAIASYRGQIKSLQSSNDTLKRTINSSIGGVSSSNVDIPLIDYKSSGDYKQYVVDLDDLLSIVQSGKLDQISRSGSLYTYYDREQFLGNIESIKQQYSGRDAVVNCAIGAISMAASVNKSIGYELIKGTNALQTTDAMVQGTDCCTFASWALSQGSNQITKTYSTSEFNQLGTKIDYSQAKKGDIFTNKWSTGGHVQVVVENHPEANFALVAESKGEGVVLTYIKYSTLQDNNYQARDLSSIY